MDTISAIMSRRSIRKYSGQPVSQSNIDEMLAAGANAPSAGNQQPWHFVVITDKEMLQKIPLFHPHASMVPEAEGAILVCYFKHGGKYNHHLPHDCSAATQNILLAAHALGLGAVWLGVYPNTDRMSGFVKLLNLPDDVIPFSCIAYGQPAEKKDAVKRLKSEMIHLNGW